MILMRLSLELMYAEMPLSLVAGKTTAACVRLAVGRKALVAIIVPLTLVWLVVNMSWRSDEGNGYTDLEALPPFIDG